ncbi:MAG: hypothetical protein A2134_01810 [Candidatus Woykebacteria bacterium RBG_16_39_9b]|uniref:Uncharacterized protein n=1 Tax=Candidatus Woykebacteria bacterium RBG_16_39_9b TaxID=1802595 RepID=A0A1G1WDV2_9BACT|nr:MAG: hypothetical protein A2134_01810 [Candidatus Woykebacteria bacterium RBG_16_39_9b]
MARFLMPSKKAGTMSKAESEEWFIKAHIKLFLPFIVGVNILVKFLDEPSLIVVAVVFYMLPAYWIFIFTRWSIEQKRFGVAKGLLGFTTAGAVVVAAFFVNLVLPEII